MNTRSFGVLTEKSVNLIFWESIVFKKVEVDKKVTGIHLLLEQSSH